MKGYVVMYDDDDGNPRTTGVVDRFDSLNELSAKTLALHKLNLGFENVKICEVEYKPIYKITHGEPGIGTGCRMEKIGDG